MNKASTIKQQNKGMLVTQPYVPDISKYMKYVEQAFNRKWLTNGGPLLEELTLRLKELLKLEYLLLVNNGTSALQIAYQTRDLSGKTALTTPFTFPATTNAMHWQNTKVEFADIDRNSWNLCPNSVAQVLKNKTIDAVVPVNIFGTACQMEDFDELAKQHDIPVIYDSAQSMLSNFKGKSIFEYGDIHCISFHATKLFHCVEGGALTFKEKSDYERAQRLINFGFDQQGYVVEPGLNSKMSELHAAMGLCILDELPNLIDDRENSIDCYRTQLSDYVEFQTTDYECYTPPMYMPIKLPNETRLDFLKNKLEEHGYESRKYFSPSFNYVKEQASLDATPICNEISNCILCLPLMHGMDKQHIKKISNIIKAG